MVIWLGLWPWSFFPNLQQNWDTTLDLPDEESDSSQVGTDVHSSSGIVSLLHGGHASCSKRPQTNQTSSSVEVRTGEELTSTSVCVQGTLDFQDRLPLVIGISAENSFEQDTYLNCEAGTKESEQ